MLRSASADAFLCFFLATQAVSGQQLLVAAAADLSPAEERIVRSFQAETGIRAVFSFGSSGMLKRQIENGAPYDVYLSANEEFVLELTKAGQVEDESVRIYATGRLGLWSSRSLVKQLADLRLTEVRRMSIPNPRHAPYGVAAEEMLRNEGILEFVKHKIVYGENVRQAYEYARTGNVEAVITAWTLVKDRGGILLPEKGYQSIRQAAGIVKGTGRRAEAVRFLDWLMSAEGQSVLRDVGLFSPAAKPSKP